MSARRQILDLNAFDLADADTLDAKTAELAERRRRTFGPTSVLLYRRPLNVVSAEGVWITEADGTRCLDLYNNVPSVGHCNPRVARAVAEQMGRLNVHTRYLFDVVHAYAERLLETLPAGLDRVAFTCTGSEANDVALRLATIATQKRGIIVTAAAYHGNTTAVADVSPSSRPGRPLASHVRAVPAPLSGEAETFEADVRAAIADLDACGVGFAALMVDTIFSSDGVAADPAGFLKSAVDAAHAAGGLFIADEVQPGFGRTGASFWGFARHGVTPDVVTMGKPMGNGVPIGAAVASEALMRGFANEVGYFNTFGGNPVSSAAALAVIDEIEERALMANAADVGRYMLDGLRQVAAVRPEIAEARGAGLYVGVEIVDGGGAPDAASASRVIDALREKNILIGAAGLYGNVLKIRPPLVLERSHADMLIDALDDVLAGPAGAT